jgi:hypothetical protein
MFGQTSTEKKTAKKFQAKLKAHLKCIRGVCQTIKLKRCPVAKTAKLAELVNIPDRDITHVFAAETMLAVSLAIEDLASEVGKGELISTFQNFRNFECHKQRYLSLARDLDAVRVWGAGAPPKRCPRIDFIVTEDPKIIRYRLVLFEGPSDHAVLVCKQLGPTKEPGQEKFIGFYSFNPYLVQSIRWRFNLLTCGLNKIVNHWDKSMVLPNLKLRELDLFLRDQKRAS